MSCHSTRRRQQLPALRYTLPFSPFHVLLLIYSLPSITTMCTKSPAGPMTLNAAHTPGLIAQCPPRLASRRPRLGTPQTRARRRLRVDLRSSWGTLDNTRAGAGRCAFANRACEERRAAAVAWWPFSVGRTSESWFAARSPSDGSSRVFAGSGAEDAVHSCREPRRFR